MDLKEHRETLLKSARIIAEKARDEKRDLTPDEARSIEAKLTESKSIHQALQDDARSKSILDDLDSQAADAQGGPLPSGQRLAFGTKMAASAAAQMLPPGLNAKALATGGSVLVGQEFATSPIEIGRPANTLLSVLPVRQHTQPQFSYLRQSVRTNNAAVVADGATKPTSVYTVIKVDNTLSVIAHLSEAVPRYWFIDNDSLQTFITSELLYGLQQAVEAKALADINATSGIQTQAYSTSVLETLRKSVTKLEVIGFAADYFLLHPSNWEALELLITATDAINYNGLPYDPVTRRLFGVPVVVSLAQAAGVSHTVAKGAVAVDTDTTGVALQWSETSNADDFAKNLVRARCEGRYATSVFRPLGVVVGDLTA
jgi:HK97 family phage major capsid protein